MSGKESQTEVVEKNDPQTDPTREQFLQRHVLRRVRVVNNRVVVRAMRAEQKKQRYQQRLASVQPLLQAAARAAQETQNINAATPIRTGYLSMVQQHALQDPDNNPDGALDALNKLVLAANQMLLVKGNIAIRQVKQRQVQAQVDEHNDIAEDLNSVKRSYITEGTAERMARTVPGAAKDQDFRPFLQAVKGLEDAKKNVRTNVKTPSPLAAQVNTAAGTVIREAQAFLDNAAGLNPVPVGKALDELNSRKQTCETAIIQARHLMMAMEFDQIPEPTADAPWDDEMQLRATGMRSQLAFERGGQKATGLAGLGTSTSYWIREQDAKTVGENMEAQARGDELSKGDRMYIFKPTDGEEFPAGSNDRQGAGAIKEALAFGNAKLFAQQTGIDLRVPETGVVSLSGGALEGGDPTQTSIGSAQRNVGSNVSEMRATDQATLARVPKDDVHRIALMDIMSLSCDRHGGNIMIDTSDPNTPRMTPIDHGGTLPSRSDFNLTKKRLAGVKSNVNSVEIVNALLSVPSAFEPFDPQMVAQLDKLDPDAMEAGMKRQRDAIGRVHPGLNPEEKVGDDSFTMSKRAMMFTKMASRTLSPAEIQIALAARGEELFDVSDNGFDQLARQIINDQAPKKDAYQEFLSLDFDEKVRISTWLRANGWTVAEDGGDPDAMGFLMRDPVNALKLYKAQRPNTNPPQDIVKPTADAPPVVTDAVDDNAKQQLGQLIKQDFPNVTLPNNPAQWKATVGQWQMISQLGGAVEYQNALTATGTPAAKRLADISDALSLWDKVRQQKAQGAIMVGKTTATISDILKKALMKAAVDRQNAQMLQDSANTGSQINDQTARAGNVNLLAATLGGMIRKFKDQGVASGLAQQVTAAQLLAQNQDVVGAEKALQALLTPVTTALMLDFKQQFDRTKGKVDLIADRKVWPQGLNKTLEMQILKNNGVTIKPGGSIADAENYVIGVKNLYRTLKACADDPNAPPQQQPQVQPNEDDDEGADDLAMAQDQDQDQDDVEEAFENDGNGDQNDDDDGQGAAPALAAFDWHESSAKAATEYAYRAGMLKKKKTGLGDNVRKVKKARKEVAGIKPTTSVRKRKDALNEAIEAYNGFGIFVASRLRIMSDAKQWQDYCNLAAEEVRTRLEETRQILNQLG